MPKPNSSRLQSTFVMFNFSETLKAAIEPSLKLPTIAFSQPSPDESMVYQLDAPKPHGPMPGLWSDPLPSAERISATEDAPATWRISAVAEERGAPSVGLTWERFEIQQQIVRRSISELKPRNVSRLIRIVSDWVGRSEQGLAPARYPDSIAHESFHTYLSTSTHRLLEREPEKDLWAWFRWWRSLGLQALDAGVSGRKLLELLFKVEELLRRRHPLADSPPPPLNRILDRLRHLAEAIVPNAPPRLAAIATRPAEAG